MLAVNRVTGGSQQSDVRRLLYGVILKRPVAASTGFSSTGLGDTCTGARVGSAGFVRVNVMETGAAIDGDKGHRGLFSSTFRTDAAHFRCLVVPTDGVLQAMPIICLSVRRTAVRRAKNASVPAVRSEACYLGLSNIQPGRDKSLGILAEVYFSDGST